MPTKVCADWLVVDGAPRFRVEYSWCSLRHGASCWTMHTTVEDILYPQMPHCLLNISDLIYHHLHHQLTIN